MLLEGCQKNIEENLNRNSAEEVIEGFYSSNMGMIFEEFNPYESFYIASNDSINTEPIKTYALGPINSPGSSSHYCQCGIEPFTDNQKRDVPIFSTLDMNLKYDDVIYKGVGNGLNFRWNSSTKIGTFNFTKVGIKNFTITGYKVKEVYCPGGAITCYCPIIVYNLSFNVDYFR